METVTACAEQENASKELVLDMLECGGEHQKEAFGLPGVSSLSVLFSRQKSLKRQ